MMFADLIKLLIEHKEKFGDSRIFIENYNNPLIMFNIKEIVREKYIKSCNIMIGDEVDLNEKITCKYK